MTEWTKQYNNDTGPDDDYFEEWFEVTDGKRVFRCEESEDADFLLFILRRQWVGLTDEELAVLHDEIKVRLMGTYRTEDIYRAIEAKLKEKNT